jgi:hypothetical protein
MSPLWKNPLWNNALRAVLGTSLIAGVYVGSSELVFPYYTVSDVLATSGGWYTYTGLVLSAAMFTARHGPSPCPLTALLILLFPLPLGTPFVLAHFNVAPFGCLLHTLAASAYVVSIAVDIVVPYSVVWCLSTLFASFYYTGLAYRQPTWVLVGCALEWMLLFIPLVYPHRLEQVQDASHVTRAGTCMCDKSERSCE